ncbi:MAG: hypothetical protein NXI07_05405 [bacterium]|nr:hypothetical protein [bacterium]
MKSPLPERVCASMICRSGTLMVLAMSLLVSLSASPVFAQDDALRPPTTKEAPSAPKYIVIGVAFLLLVLVAIVASLKSKRGHQD